MGGDFCTKTWSKNEIDTLIQNYNHATNSELKALIPGKSDLAIYKKAYKLGMRKTEEIEFKDRSEAKRREKSSNWNGGRKITPSGYVQVLIPEHPRADTNGYVMEHIYVFEKYTGVPVPAGCCIHHLNGNKLDNRISNLCMMQKGAHTTFHHTGMKMSDETKEKISTARRKSNA